MTYDMQFWNGEPVLCHCCGTELTTDEHSDLCGDCIASGCAPWPMPGPRGYWTDYPLGYDPSVADAVWARMQEEAS